ncbi:MAG: hypothetical protein COA47_04725 [Robiginitomaculum sp.]|nr:MAG: hypothetical protein COA47_04725 [Robiginitomaculum sp.]
MRFDRRIGQDTERDVSRASQHQKKHGAMAARAECGQDETRSVADKIAAFQGHLAKLKYNDCKVCGNRPVVTAVCLP